jgi:hypothetical protein
MKFFVNFLALSFVFFGSIDATSGSNKKKKRVTFKEGLGLTLRDRQRLTIKNSSQTPERQKQGSLDWLTGSIKQWAMNQGPHLSERKIKKIIFADRNGIILSAFGQQVCNLVLQQGAIEAQAQGDEPAWTLEQFRTEVPGGLPRWHREKFPDDSNEGIPS